MPRVTDAYNEGFDAFEDGQGIEKNPYDILTQSQAHLSWNDGWNDAEEEHDNGEDD